MLHEVETVFIIGAGVMGVGTALDVAAHGHTVRVKDISEAKLQAAEQGLRQAYRAARMLNPHYQSLSFEDIQSRVMFQLGYDGIEAAGLVIENITENVAQKQAEYQRVRQYCLPKTLFALNTSCIEISMLAEYLPDPRRVMGVHLMNPVAMKTLVEVIRGKKTSQATEQAMVGFLARLGKRPVVIHDQTGFVSNRISHLLMNEAAAIVQDGVATVEQVDCIMQQGFGHPMGPLATADLIGLDTVAHSLDVLHDHYQEKKFQCCDLLREKVAAGACGRKSGKGFYDYGTVKSG